MQESLKAICSLEDPSSWVYIYFYVHSQWHVYLHVELFEVVSTAQNLAHDIQQVVEFQSGSLHGCDFFFTYNEDFQLD